MSRNLAPVSNAIQHSTDPLYQQVIAQLNSVLLGKGAKVHLALACMIAKGHLLIEDIPGVGKTTLAHALSASLGLPWNRVQFTSDLLPADIIGVSIYDSASASFTFKPGPVFTSILLADEINRAPPRAQSALLQAMEERSVSVDGETRSLADDFFVIATQNNAEQLGAYPLPESQLDRFLCSIEIGYPDPVSERELLAGGDRRSNINNLPTVTAPNDLADWTRTAQTVEVSETILDYIQALILSTREVALQSDNQGLSPRAALGLLNMSKAWAMLAGRKMVLPEDVQQVFPSVAGHRMTGSVRDGKIVCKDILDRVALS